MSYRTQEEPQSKGLTLDDLLPSFSTGMVKFNDVCDVRRAVREALQHLSSDELSDDADFCALMATITQVMQKAVRDVPVDARIARSFAYLCQRAGIRAPRSARAGVSHG